MKNKIIVFVYDKKKDKFLLINNTKHPNHSLNGGLFTINLSINHNEYAKSIAVEQIKKEIGLIPEEVFSLNWGAVYSLNDEEFKEMNFLAFVNPDKNNLDKHSSKHKWYSINPFIEKIEWKDDKELLKKILIKGINKEVFFDKKERGN